MQQTNHSLTLSPDAVALALPMGIQPCPEIVSIEECEGSGMWRGRDKDGVIIGLGEYAPFSVGSRVPIREEWRVFYFSEPMDGIVDITIEFRDGVVISKRFSKHFYEKWVIDKKYRIDDEWWQSCTLPDLFIRSWTEPIASIEGKRYPELTIGQHEACGDTHRSDHAELYENDTWLWYFTFEAKPCP